MKELPKKLFYGIGEIAEHFGVAQSLVRFWEGEFPGLQPKRNAKGSRFYTAENVEEFKMIYHLVKEKGYTLEGAKAMLKKERSQMKNKIRLKESLTELRGFLIDVRDKLMEKNEA
jgi:DNA-binding transcriptional MerR regulator